MHEGRAMRPDAAGAAKDLKPVAPSPVKFKFGVVPHELTIEKLNIWKISLLPRPYA